GHGTAARPAQSPDRACRPSQGRGQHLEPRTSVEVRLTGVANKKLAWGGPMEKVLNQQEIDDMVRVARSGAADAASKGPVVQPWDIRQAGQIGSEQLRAINQLHENFARNLTTAISGYLRIVFGASLVSAEHLTY